MYGIYEAVYFASWKIDDLRIDDRVFRAASDGDIVSQNRIIAQYQAKIRKHYGQDKSLQTPGRIYWDDQQFDIKRLRDAAAPKSRSARTVQRPTQSFDRCDCECAQCDIGYHCHNPRRDCNLRP